MRIDKTNVFTYLADADYFHDYILLTYQYDAICKEITVEIEKVSSREKHMIVFKNVECFEMVGGDSWGNSEIFPRIIEWCPIDDDGELLLHKLEKRIFEFSRNRENICLKDFFQTRFLFSSGNFIDIFCEYIDIDIDNLIDMKNDYVCNRLKYMEKSTL